MTDATKPIVRALRPSDLHAVHRLLEHDFGWDGGRTALDRLLSWEWLPAEFPRGLVVEVGDRLVGFLATILSPWPRSAPNVGVRPSREQTIGSFSFYHVLPEYRAASLPLLKHALALADRWTSLTPNAYSQSILRMAGFRVLSEGFRFLLPSPSWLHAGGWRVRRATPEMLEPLGLGGVARHHASYGCRTLLASKAHARVVLVTKRRSAGGGRVRLPVSEVLYVSHPELLADAWPAVARAIALHDRTPIIALDDAFDPDRRIPGGRARPRIRMARGLPDGTPIDALYSELVLLN